MNIFCIGNIQDLLDQSNAAFAQFQQFSQLGIFHTGLLIQSDELLQEYEREWAAARPLYHLALASECWPGRPRPLPSKGPRRVAVGTGEREATSQSGREVQPTPPHVDKNNTGRFNDGLDSGLHCQLPLTLV